MTIKEKLYREIINHPAHYKAGSMEVIDVIESFGLGFHLGNAIKYILRAGRKTNNTEEDIEKAIWYLERYVNDPKRKTV